MKPESWENFFKEIRKKITPAGDEGELQGDNAFLGAVENRSLEGEIFFHISDRPDLSHAFVFEGGKLFLEPSNLLDADTLVTDYASYRDFLKTGVPSRNLFKMAAGPWQINGMEFPRSRR